MKYRVIVKNILMIAFLYCIYFSTVCQASQQAWSTGLEDLNDEYSWYLIDALGCYIPIPKTFVLATEREPFSFYEMSSSDQNIELGHIYIHEKEKGVAFSKIGGVLKKIIKEGDYTLYHVTISRKTTNKNIGYYMEGLDKSILISHFNNKKEKNIALYVFNYCVKSVINGERHN